MVRVSDSSPKGHGFEFRKRRWENFLLQGQLPVLTPISVSVPPPCHCSSKDKADVSVDHGIRQPYCLPVLVLLWFGRCEVLNTKAGC